MVLLIDTLVYEAKVGFGNIQESGKSFDKAIKINAHYLDTQVLKAQYFAAKTQMKSFSRLFLKGLWMQIQLRFLS